jgi:hypothetical protein
LDPVTGHASTLAGACGEPGAADGSDGDARFGLGIKSLVCLANCSVLVGDVSTGTLRSEAAVADACVRACS